MTELITIANIRIYAYNWELLALPENAHKYYIIVSGG